MSIIHPKRIILSRTDSIGDVVLTLPMAGWIKKKYPDCYLIFIGRNYTTPVIHCSIHVDEVVSWDAPKTKKDQVEFLESFNADMIFHVFPEKEVVEAAKKANIKWRVATGRRKHTFQSCNKRLWWTRKNSDLHESQLNLKMLSVIGLKRIPSVLEIPEYYGFNNIPELIPEFKDLLKSDKINLVLHPKSKGSAVEWGLENFSELIKSLEGEVVQIFITGTKAERELIGDELPWKQNNLTDLTGKMSLDDLIAFLNEIDVIVAGSTGPVHIASALDTNAIGLYSPKRPMHPGRWMPIGKHSEFITASKHPEAGYLDISFGKVADLVLSFKLKKT